MKDKHEKDKHYRKLIINNYAIGIIGVLLAVMIILIYAVSDYMRIDSQEMGKLRILIETTSFLIIIMFVILNMRSMRLLKNLNEAKKQLEISARFDSLTELKNRSYFFERVMEEMERAKRTKSRIVLLVMDLDNFKFVNDNYGHPEGDIVLKKIAEAFQKSIRTTDIVGRVGGEEFAILLTDTGITLGREVAERIRKEVHTVNIKEWKGGVSIGAAEWKQDMETLEVLYKRADDALYQAKRQGRNKVITSED